MAELDPIVVKLRLDASQFHRELRKAKRRLRGPSPLWPLFWIAWGLGFGALAASQMLGATTTDGQIFFGVCMAIDFIVAGFWFATLVFER